MKSGTIVAVATMQNDPVVSKASELLRLGLMPSPEEIKNGKVGEARVIDNCLI